LEILAFALLYFNGGEIMRRYLTRRLLQIVPVLLLIAFIVFALVYMAGDPVVLMLPDDATPQQVEQLREALGLDQPFLIQFGSFLLNLITFDFGSSYRYSASALSIVMERLPATFLLGAVSMLIATVIAIPLGIYSATKQNTTADVFATGASVLGKAMPNFWLGIMLILVFSVNFQIFPVSGMGTFWHLVLPAITLGTGAAADMTRLTRSSMLDILDLDYIRTARSKGAKEKVVIYKHAFRNSLIPVITIMFLQTSSLVSGALITEQVFAWPGIGQLLIQSVYARDMAIIQACVFIIALIVIIANLLADIMYYVLDPRIKYK
jgi:peptide/nickel transport system permease protein